MYRLLTLASLAFLPASLLAEPATTRLDPVRTILGGIATDQLALTNPFILSEGGSTGIVTIEVDGDFTALQVGLENGGAPWGIARLAVAPGAAYGTDAAIGEAARDLDGNLVPPVPVQFGNGGALSAPNALVPVSALLLAQDAAPGTQSLAFASTTPEPVYGAPKRGWYVSDASGCVAPGTRVASVTSTTIGLSQPLASRCPAGLAVWFQAQPFRPLAQTIAGADPATGVSGLTFSDWIPVQSFPRLDAAPAVGSAVTAPGLSTTIAGSTVADLMLAGRVSVPLAARTPVTVSTSAPLASAAAKGTRMLALNGAGFRPGTAVSGPGIGPRTHVVTAGPASVTIDVATTAAIPAGTTIASTSVYSLAAAAQPGDRSLHVASLSQRRLVQLRFQTQDAGLPWSHNPTCAPDPVANAVACEAPLGLPPSWTLAGPAGVDGIALPGAVSGSVPATQVAIYPAFFLRLQGTRPGATMLVCGGFQAAGGAGSVSGTASFAHIAAAAANRGTTPLVSVVDTASTGLDVPVNMANCRNWLTALQPSILVQQDYSNHNNSSVTDYKAQVDAIGQQAIAMGTQSVIYLAYTEGSSPVGALPVAGSVKNSTTVPLLCGANADVAAAGALVTGPGVPDGTTGTMQTGDWFITLSQPVSLPAGTVLHYGYVLAGLDPSGTGLSLTANAFQTKDNNTVEGDGIPPRTRLSTRQDSAAAEVSAPVAATPGTPLTVSFYVPFGSRYEQAAELWRPDTDPWATLQVDAAGILGTDPVHPYLLCNGCTTHGEYANDWANTLVAQQFLPVLQGLLMQGKGTGR